MTTDSPAHVPVMLKEVLEYLKPQAGQIFVDGTVGLAGHAKAILPHLGPEGKLIAIDRDERSLKLAKDHLKEFARQCEWVHDDYRNIAQILKDLKLTCVDRILLDLGVSSFQLDDPERGFSLRLNGPLDMRMDQRNSFSARDLIDSFSEKDLIQILHEFGEERWSKRIAHRLVLERSKKAIKTTENLVSVILNAIPRSYSREKIHPATRTFQAIRIVVNKELEGIQQVLNSCAEVLIPGGRMGVISFHSLEDRIVKQKFREEAKNGRLKLMTKKPLRPTLEEIEHNPRARSARFRVAERI